MHDSKYPDSGGAFKVQIFSPYIVVNKSGIPFSIRATRSTRSGYHEAAGPTQVGESSTSKLFLLINTEDRRSEKPDTLLCVICFFKMAQRLFV